MDDTKRIEAELAAARSESVDSLIYKLERAGTGANVHTVNKAIFYLRYFSENEQARYPAHIPGYDRLLFLKVDVLDALASNNYTSLAYFLKTFF